MTVLRKPLNSAIVIISDFLDHGPAGNPASALPPAGSDFDAPPPHIEGGYLERLPLAAINWKLADFGEIWHHRTGEGQSYSRDNAHLVRRSFQVDTALAPFHSTAMLEFIGRYGAPKILCVWGLGVSEQILEACRNSFIIYNSIDAPALRVPANISRHFDLVLTGAQWQSDEVNARHPGKATAILPIGPEFASPDTFFPTGDAKRYDVVYVAAAQAYKRHDILFAALARAARPLSALCVMGYGEEADALRRQAYEQGLDVDFVGPPGVPHAEVNRLMNLARVGVVCGVDDGAPAILTEYMLAGLPVVANADLKCGLHYILPQTGLIASAERLDAAIIDAIDRPDRFSPRQAVLDRWAWPHSIARLERLIAGRPADTLSSHYASSSHPEGGSIEPSSSAPTL